jgi:carboxypeptidase Q
MKGILACLVVIGLLHQVPPVHAEEPVDWEVVTRIREEGFSRSQVMETLRHLTDAIGPRLTGSPGMAEANQWTRRRLEEWGLENARMEPWGPFGRGWTFERVAVHMTEPHTTVVFALPQAWTPSTAGPVRGEVRLASFETAEDLEPLRGQVRGQILLLPEDREPNREDEPALRRFDRDGLRALTELPLDDPRDPRRDFRARARERWAFARQRNQFLADEGVVATFAMSSRDGGILRVGAAGSREPGQSVGVPTLVMSAEQFRWIVRLVEAGRRVVLELDVSTTFHDADLMAANTVADIRGADLRHELVMVGAHLDSWHAATGSNDNAAGVAVAMEAVRILRAIGVEPRRTIRVALWTGEEQGLLGSRAYVREHFASRPTPDDPELRDAPLSLWPETWPIQYHQDWDRFSAYFNLDNGSGRIRGVYTQGNLGVVPIFESWLRPFHDVGADTVTNRNTGGTDHLPFDAVGLPGFQFIQDSLDYSTRTHHTNLDHFDHASAADLQQASVVMASFLYHAAMRDQKLPRKPRPQPVPPRPPARETGG